MTLLQSTESPRRRVAPQSAPGPRRGGPAAAASRKGNAAQRKAAVMRWLRRGHLFSGLFLLPWVLIYGVSGFLFNHGGGGAASESRELTVPADAFDAADPVAIVALGERLLTAIERPAAAADASLAGAWTFDFRRRDASAASADSSDEPSTWRLSVPIDGGPAVLTERAARTQQTLRYERGTFDAEREHAERRAAAILTTHGIDADGLRAVGSPTLEVQADGRRYSASLTRDFVREGVPGEFDLGRLMRRLHVTHGYGRSGDGAWARTVWAVFVDAMAAAMVLWSVTGVLMWWQKRSMRLPGAIVLGAAVLGGTALVASLHVAFSN